MERDPILSLRSGSTVAPVTVESKEGNIHGSVGNGTGQPPGVWRLTNTLTHRKPDTCVRVWVFSRSGGRYLRVAMGLGRVGRVWQVLTQVHLAWTVYTSSNVTPCQCEGFWAPHLHNDLGMHSP